MQARKAKTRLRFGGGGAIMNRSRALSSCNTVFNMHKCERSQASQKCARSAEYEKHVKQRAV
jgi:hypothetical protein